MMDQRLQALHDLVRRANRRESFGVAVRLAIWTSAFLAVAILSAFVDSHRPLWVNLLIFTLLAAFVSAALLVGPD